MNRHFSPTINSQFVEKNNTCIHTRNILSLVDLPTEDEQYVKLKKHSHECKVCSSHLESFQVKCIESKIYIPKPQIDLDTKITFNNEVHELFKTFELSEKLILKKKIKNKIKIIDHAGTSFLQNLGSWSMVKTYAFAIALFVLLKKYFN